MPKKIKNVKYFEAVGRRKESVAQVRLYISGRDKTSNVKGLKIKTGEIYLNKKPIDQFFPASYEKVRYLYPLEITDNLDRFAVSILVRGGGRVGQLEAIIHGLAKAIEVSDKEKYRPILKKQGLLTRDSRIRERRKVGTGGKARRAKQSPKR